MGALAHGVYHPQNATTARVYFLHTPALRLMATRHALYSNSRKQVGYQSDRPALFGEILRPLNPIDEMDLYTVSLLTRVSQLARLLRVLPQLKAVLKNVDSVHCVPPAGPIYSEAIQILLPSTAIAP